MTDKNARLQMLVCKIAATLMGEGRTMQLNALAYAIAIWLCGEDKEDRDDAIASLSAGISVALPLVERMVNDGRDDWEKNPVEFWRAFQEGMRRAKQSEQ